MQNHGELSSNRDFGFAEPASFRDPHAPGFEHRPFCNASQKNACRLVEIASQHRITAFRNPSRPVDFTGCIPAARQADISSDTSRALEARWIIDGREITERSDRADTRRCHEASHLTIVARQSHHLAIEVGNLLLDGLTHLEERLDCGDEFRPILDQLRGAHGEHVHLGLADDEAEVLEYPADLVLEISFDLDEQCPTDEKGFDRVTVAIFDANLLVPSTLHDACDAYGAVTVALIDLHLQSRFRVPSIDADNRELHFIQLGP